MIYEGLGWTVLAACCWDLGVWMISSTLAAVGFLPGCWRAIGDAGTTRVPLLPVKPQRCTSSTPLCRFEHSLPFANLHRFLNAQAPSYCRHSFRDAGTRPGSELLTITGQIWVRNGISRWPMAPLVALLLWLALLWWELTVAGRQRV